MEEEKVESEVTTSEIPEEAVTGEVTATEAPGIEVSPEEPVVV